MKTNFTDIEKNYLKRMAALQFPGSKENYSTRHPIHFLQEQTDEYVKVEMSEFEDCSDEIVLIEYMNCGDYETYKTVEELVAYHLDINLDNPEEVKRFNDDAEENDEIQFVTFAEAVNTNDIPGCDEPVFDVADYLTAYGLDPDDVTFYKYGDGWDVKAVSFTHKGAVDMQEKLSNHIFRPTRFYAFTTVDGDFPVLMGVLLKLGQELLAEENNGLEMTVLKSMTPEQVTAQYEATPDEEFCVASFEIKFPQSQKFGVKREKGVLTVVASGHVQDWGDRRYPVAKLKMSLETDEERKECPWPFECDGGCASLTDRRNVINLLNYIRYV